MNDAVNDLGATKEEDDQITAKSCNSCDFGLGRRGMDTCARCHGIGSVLTCRDKSFPNDRRGYENALEFLRKES